jgi:hypothetical protein
MQVKSFEKHLGEVIHFIDATFETKNTEKNLKLIKEYDLIYLSDSRRSDSLASDCFKFG